MSFCVCMCVSVRVGGGYWSSKCVWVPQAVSQIEMRKEGSRGGSLAIREVWADLGRQDDAGVWLLSVEQVLCVCTLWRKGNASQRNIEISTDTTKIERNNSDEGLQMISALEPFLKKTTPAHLRLCELHHTQRRRMWMPHTHTYTRASIQHTLHRWEGFVCTICLLRTSFFHYNY